MEPLARALRCSGGDLEQVKRIHALILDAGLGRVKYMADQLLVAYAKCRAWDDAERVFENSRRRNELTWNLLIAGYAQNGQMPEARATFERMPLHCVIAGTALIRGYRKIAHIKEARRVFEAMAYRDLMCWNTMLATYCCGMVKEAKWIFDAMPQKDIISWTTLVRAFAHAGGHEQFTSRAKNTFDRMPAWNSVAWNTAIEMYADEQRLEQCRELFQSIPADARNVVTCTTMIKALTQGGHLQDARRVFDGMTSCDIVSWTTMLRSEATEGGTKQVLLEFDSMPKRDAVAWTTLLTAFAQRPGHLKQAHSTFERMPLWDLVTMNVMVSVCANHGRFQQAMEVMKLIPEQDLVTWSLLVAGYAHNGQAQLALDTFSVMLLEGIVSPDELMFLSLLAACSHAGLLQEGRSRFVSMTYDHGIVPIIEHYQCMADILGRNGKLQEAEELLETMPFLPSVSAWGSLQAACNLQQDKGRGARIGKRHIHLENTDDGTGYMLLANLHSGSSELIANSSRKKSGAKFVEGWVQRRHRVLPEL